MDVCFPPRAQTTREIFLRATHYEILMYTVLVIAKLIPFPSPSPPSLPPRLCVHVLFRRPGRYITMELIEH